MDTTNLPPTDAGVPGQPVVPPVPVQPVSGGNKEHAPITQRSEYLAPAPAESVPHIPQELSELGIEVSPDTDRPDIPPDATQAGVKPVKTATPVATAPQGVVTVPALEAQAPFTSQQTTQNLKSHKADESITWLSMLSQYILAKIGWQNAGEKGE